MIDSAALDRHKPLEILCYISDMTNHAYEREEIDANVVRGPRLVLFGTVERSPASRHWRHLHAVRR